MEPNSQQIAVRPLPARLAAAGMLFLWMAGQYPILAQATGTLGVMVYPKREHIYLGDRQIAEENWSGLGPSNSGGLYDSKTASTTMTMDGPIVDNNPNLL